MHDLHNKNPCLQYPDHCQYAIGKSLQFLDQSHLSQAQTITNLSPVKMKHNTCCQNQPITVISQKASTDVLHYLQYMQTQGTHLFQNPLLPHVPTQQSIHPRNLSPYFQTLGNNPRTPCFPEPLVEIKDQVHTPQHL